MSYIFPVQGKWRWGGGVGEHRKRPLGNWQSDNAVDIMAPAGSTFVSPVSGRVLRISGRDPRQGAYGSSGTLFGRSITIQAPDGNEWFATHLDNPIVRVGQFVTAGSPLSRIGDWGERSHAHVATSRGDPQALLSGAAPSQSGLIPESAVTTTAATGAGCITVLLAQLAAVGAVAYALVEVFA